jgi:hypothetical protein
LEICSGIEAWRSSGFSRSSGPFHGDFPAIAAPRKRFDIAGLFGGVAQHLAQAVDGRADAVFELNNSAVRPKSVSNLLARNELSGVFEQHRQDSEWLLGESDWLVSLPAEFTGAKVKLETFETGYSIGT